MYKRQKLLLRDRDNQRIIAAEDFFIGPRRSVLNSGELLYEIIISLPQNGAKAEFIKFGRRKALSLSIVNGAVMLELNKDKEVLACRIALGAVAPVPVRAYKAEAFLIGKEISIENIATAAEIISGEISPISDIRASAEYRLRMSQVIVKRALEQCL